MTKLITINGLVGNCGGREVFLGFAKAALLHEISYADVLNEETGIGYQRRFNDKHSLDFRQYIQQPGSTTIPLTFNLRPCADQAWTIKRSKNGAATLRIKNGGQKILSQVDCQHRLGYLAGLDTSLSFMSFIGLDVKEEMSIFTVINGKAKGLSGSLLDYHEAKLVVDIAKDRPELYLSLKLNDDESSPWYKKLDLGGKQVSGMSRKASLRTMQKAIKRFLRETQILKDENTDEVYIFLLDFWCAITLLLADEWRNSRKHFLTKGIGVYALNSLAADIYTEAKKTNTKCNYTYLVAILTEFIQEIDWSNTGPLKGLGGESGVGEAIAILRSLRNKGQLELISNA